MDLFKNAIEKINPKSLSSRKRKKEARQYWTSSLQQFNHGAAEGAEPTEMTVTEGVEEREAEAVDAGAAEAGVGPLKPDGSAL